jgi:hypothetical protein
VIAKPQAEPCEPTAGSGSGTPWFIAWQFRMSGNGELNIQYDPENSFPLPEVMQQKLAILQ